MSLKRLKHQLRIFKVLAQGCSGCPYTGTCMPSWRENQWEKLESGRGGQGPEHYLLLLSFWLNFLASGYKAPFNSHTHVCKIRTYFASEGVMQLPIHIGLGKSPVTIWSRGNLVFHDRWWVFCTQTRSYRTGAQKVVTCPNAQQPQPEPQAVITVTTSPHPEFFSPWPQAPGPLRKDISWLFLHCLLQLPCKTRAISNHYLWPLLQHL